MTTPIQTAVNAIYSKLTRTQRNTLYKMPIRNIDGLLVYVTFNKEVFSSNNIYFKFNIDLMNSCRSIHSDDTNVYQALILQQTLIEDEVKTFIYDILRELPSLKFDKTISMFKTPDDISPDDAIYDLFKDEENMTLRLKECPCCFAITNFMPCKNKHYTCLACYAELPYVIEDGIEEQQKKCPTCRENMLDYDSEEDSD